MQNDDEAPPPLPEEQDEPLPDDQPYGPADDDDAGYTTSDFQTVVQKQVLNAAYETLVETKFHWGLVEPFLQAAREMCLGDFRRTGRIQIHGVVAEGERWTDAEEAYVGLSIADQDDGREWLSQTWWLSDLVLASGDPGQVREAARALERTVAKLDAWLDEQEKSPGEGG